MGKKRTLHCRNFSHTIKVRRLHCLDKNKCRRARTYDKRNIKSDRTANIKHYLKNIIVEKVKNVNIMSLWTNYLAGYGKPKLNCRVAFVKLNSTFRDRFML